MTVYEINYKARLEEMLDTVIRTFGHESKQAIRMATYVEKYYDNCSYQNMETVEAIYKNIMKVIVR